MIYFNKVELCGRVVNKPELRHTKDNVPVTNFTLKTIDTWKKNNSLNNIKYHNIICWGDTAERAVKILDKGFVTYLEGELCYHKGTKKVEIEEGKSIDVNVMNVEIRCLNIQTCKHVEPEFVPTDDDDSEMSESDT